MCMPLVSFSSPRSWLFRSSSARHFAAGYVRWVPSRNICGKLAAQSLVEAFSCHAGLISRCASLKYLVLSFFAYAVIGMSAASIAEFLNSPYALIVDVRMLNFFRYLGGTAAWVVLGLVIASIFVQNFWCRYLCPYGGFLGLVSLLSPMRITRNASTCIDCAKCAKACPSALPVDKLVQIRSAECTGCLECVAVCPARRH